MRTILAFSVLILVLCVGCPQTTPDPFPEKTVEPVETPETDKPEPLIEPLVPRERPPEVPSKEETAVTSDILRKYAAAVVPLPPLEDLTTQIDEYIARIGRSLDDLDGSPRYATGATDIARDANALALLALAVGLADADSQYKRSASHIITAAKHLAAAQDIEEGRRAYNMLLASRTTAEEGAPLSWSDRVADLKPLMQALPNLSSALKRVADTESRLNIALDRRAQQIFGQFAALAVISQGSVPNVAETAKPEAVEEWKKYCEEFRDAALKANAAVRRYAGERAVGTSDYTLFSTAFRGMLASCDDCHRAFYPSAIGVE